MRVLIVDDEPPARARLRTLLDGIPDIQVCGEAGNGIEAVRLAAELLPDMVLMDVRMPGMDGLEAARHLAEAEPPPAVIFVTAFGDHAIAAFESGAVGYVLKPVRAERLAAAIESARRITRVQTQAVAPAMSRSRTHLCARVRGRLELIPVADVFSLRADQKYTVVRHRHGEVLIEEPLKDLEAEFGDRFLRVHRNALVARDAIAALHRERDGGFTLELRDGERIEVSRRQAAEVREIIKRL